MRLGTKINELAQPGNEVITGLGKAAGGMQKEMATSLPMMNVLDKATGGAVGRIVEGVSTGIAETLTKGRNGVGGMVSGVEEGDPKKFLSSAKDVGEMGMLVTPTGAARGGAKAAATSVVKEAGKDGLKDSVKTEVENQVKDQV